jgi:4-alpha-glucanotransferase
MRCVFYLARSPALLLTVQLDDLAGEQQQPNLPGTAAEYPNWRRRLGRTLEDIAADPAIAPRGMQFSLLAQHSEVNEATLTPMIRRASELL